MGRSSRLLQHGNPKFNYLKKKKKLILTCSYFDLVGQTAEIVLVGLNMNLSDDIRDASSSLRGSTSSC